MVSHRPKGCTTDFPGACCQKFLKVYKVDVEFSLSLCVLLYDATQGEDLVCASLSFPKTCLLSSQLLVHCICYSLEIDLCQDALFQGRLCRSARRLSWAVATLYWCLSSLPASDLQHLLIPGTYSSAVVWGQSYTLRSRSFSTSKCCRPLGLDSVFLSFSFRVAVTRWWSLPTSGPLLTWTSSSDHVHILLIIRWSIWFLSLPLGEYQVSLWTSRCKKSGPPRAKS